MPMCTNPGRAPMEWGRYSKALQRVWSAATSVCFMGRGGVQCTLLFKMSLAHSGRLLCCALTAIAAAIAAQLPVIPTGLDSYRLWAKWHYQRIGMRAYMRSTYDRNGNNERADASHF